MTVVHFQDFAGLVNPFFETDVSNPTCGFSRRVG